MILERHKNEEAFQDAKSCKAVSGSVPSEIILTQKERPIPIVGGMVFDAEEKRENGERILLFVSWLLCTVTSYLKLRFPRSRGGLLPLPVSHNTILSHSNEESKEHTLHQTVL